MSGIKNRINSPPSPTSTNLEPQYSIAAFIKQVEVEYPGNYIEVMPDLLDYNFSELLERVPSYRDVAYDGETPLTTIIYREYGNTSLLWFVVMYNGFIHPMELPAGRIKIPDIGELNTYINEVKSKAGLTVLI